MRLKLQALVDHRHSRQAWSLSEELAMHIDKPNSENCSDQVTDQVLKVIGTQIYYTPIGEH